jgi:hypothetical protein
MSYSWGFDNSQWYPPHNDPYTLSKFGWVQPTTITESGMYPVKLMDSMPSASDVHVYKIDKGYKTGEYLLLQYFRFTGVSAGSRCPGTSASTVCKGVVMYLVDEAKTGSSEHNNQGYPGQAGWPTNGNHYKVALLQKDRQYHLEKGDGVGTFADFYVAGDTLMPSVDPNNPVYPNTNSYQGGVITPTNIQIRVENHPDPNYMNLFVQIPTLNSTPSPVPGPTPRPTPFPTSPPTPIPTKNPTPLPTLTPTKTPTPFPTKSPTTAPTPFPTFIPTTPPMGTPTIPPTWNPTEVPTPNPTVAPTPSPTFTPTPVSTTSIPVASPTMAPKASVAIFPNQDFESGSIGNIFVDGGDDCAIVRYDTETAIASTNNLAGVGSGGSYCVRLRDNAGVGSSVYTNLMSMAAYNSLTLEFDFYVSSFENREDFFVEWSQGGNVWTIEKRWIAGRNLVQNKWIRAFVAFDTWEVAGRPSNIAIRIRADASGDGDKLYIDNTMFFGVVGTVPAVTVSVDDRKDKGRKSKKH